MGAVETIEKVEALDVTIEEIGEKVRLIPGSRAPPELVEEIQQNKQEILTLLCKPETIITKAFAFHDRVWAVVMRKEWGMDDLMREIGRLSWAVADLQDAGLLEGAWKPLQMEQLRLEREWEERRGINR